jgi:gamma-glutamyltranspeptidase/glutathione hydrolase
MHKHKIQFTLALIAGIFTLGMNRENAMAQDRSQGRSMVISQTGIVATESPLASKAGAAILERGGNAIDAAIAAHAVMTVVAPVWNGIGGDLFAIVYDAKSGKYYGLNASGWAPAAQSLERLRQKGLREMPMHGIEPVTVPGSVDGWQKLLDRFGKKKMNEVLAPAIQIAEDGYPVTEWIAQHFTSSVDLLRENEEAARTFLISDRAPRMGEILRNPDLAWSLRQIAQGGRDAFYRGEITKRILALSARHGGTLAAKDFSEYSSEWVEPISTTYRGWTVYEMPPNVQGIGALEMLNLMERFDLHSYGLNSTRALHVQIEAKKLAYADVIRYIGDPKTSKLCGSRRQHGFVHRIQLRGIRIGTCGRRDGICFAQSRGAVQPGPRVTECDCRT